jgi:hypothetical protein
MNLYLQTPIINYGMTSFIGINLLLLSIYLYVSEICVLLGLFLLKNKSIGRFRPFYRSRRPLGTVEG